VSQHLPAQPGLTSIVIPCFNQREYLGEALSSACRQPGTEVILVDDGSTDGSAARADDFPQVRLVQQANRGVAAARNAGLAVVRGEFVLFLDADDRLHADAVAALRSALMTHPEAVLAYGHYRAIDEAGRPQTGGPAPRGQGDAYEAMLQSNYICVPAAALYRTDVLRKRGGFPSGIDPVADYALYLRLTRDAAIVEVEEVVVDYRRHRGSMSARPVRMLAATLRVHRQQRAYAVTPPLRKAWRAGRRYWQEFYGDRFMDQIRGEWRSGRRLAAAWHGLVLAWHTPRVFLKHLTRKIALYRNRYKTNLSSS
jgi:glycosyltransferase involved in cell wall biosynthesis